LAVPTTDSELDAIAAAAIIGDSSPPSSAGHHAAGHPRGPTANGWVNVASTGAAVWSTSDGQEAAATGRMSPADELTALVDTWTRAVMAWVPLRER